MPLPLPLPLPPLSFPTDPSSCRFLAVDWYSVSLTRTFFLSPSPGATKQLGQQQGGEGAKAGALPVNPSVKVIFGEIDKLPGVVLALYVILFVGGIPFLLWEAITWRRLKSTDFDPDEDGNISLLEFIFFAYKNLTTSLSLWVIGFLIGTTAACYTNFDASDSSLWEKGKDFYFTLVTKCAASKEP